MSEPSPFVSTEQQRAEQQEKVTQEQQKLGEDQIANEQIFKELNQERLRELEQQENEEIKQQTHKEFDLKGKTLKEFLAGFSDTILGIINDVLYKLSNPQDTNFEWNDVLTTDNRIMYLGLLVVVISIFIALVRQC